MATTSSIQNESEPTVRLEPSSGTTQFTTETTATTAAAAASTTAESTTNNNNRQAAVAENVQHYPLASVRYVVDQLSGFNEKALFKKRLVSHYPAKFVLFTSLVILLCNFVVLYCEISLNQLRYYQYNVYYVSKYAVITSLTNNLYSILALLTIKFRNYFFIQVVIMLHLVGFFATSFLSVFLNIISFILVVMENSCQGHCVLIETLTILAACVSAVFSMVFFIKLQFNFMRRLNLNAFRP